jgi:hypothetical protein
MVERFGRDYTRVDLLNQAIRNYEEGMIMNFSPYHLKKYVEIALSIYLCTEDHSVCQLEEITTREQNRH